MYTSELCQFIEQAPVAAAMFDREMRYVAVSERWLADRNLDKSIIGRTVYEVYPDVDAKFRDLYNRALAGETISRSEDRFDIPHGSVEWVRWEMRPWRDPQGEIGGLVIFAEDITERKRIEEALRRSEERYREAIEASNEGIWEWDLLANTVVFSSTFYRILGYEPLKDVSHSTEFGLSLMHPDDRLWAPKAALDRLWSIGHYQLEFRLRANDGAYRWILSRAKVVARSEAGAPIRAVGTHTDVTDERRAKEALQRSEERFRFAIDATNDGLWDWWLVTGRADFSPAYFRMLGYEQSECEAEAASFWIDHLHPNERERIVTLSRSLLNSPGHYELEFRLRAKDGSYRWILSRGKAVEWSKTGEAVRAVGTHTDITDRKNAEQRLLQRESELRQKHEELEALYQNAPIGLAAFDRQLRYLRINQRLAQIGGLPPDAHIGRTIPEILPSMAPIIEEAARAVLAGQSPIKNRELSGETFAHPGGRRYFTDSWYPIFDDQGTIQGCGVVVDDITQRKETELILRQTSERLELAQSAALIGIWDWDLLTGEAFVNDQWRSIYGISASKAVSYEEFLARLHPADRESFLNTEKRTFAGGGAIEGEMRIVREEDGETRWVAHKGRVFFASNGQPTRAMGAVWDITPLKEAQAVALQRSEDRYWRMINAAQEGIWLLDAEAKTTFVNPKMAQLLGYTTEEMLGRHLLDFVDDEWRRIAQDKLIDRSGGIVETHDFKFRRKDGAEIWTLMSCAPVFDGDTYQGALAMVLDFTERRRFEEERARHIEELNRIDRQKDEFIATLGHELRTPLASIKLAADLLAGDLALPERHRARLTRMERQIQHLNVIVEDVLDASRLASGKIRLNQEVIDIKKLLAQIEDFHQSRCKQKGIRLSMDLADQALLVYGDSVRLTQIFSNLLDNAEKFTHQGGTVHLVASQQMDEVVVVIRDTGIGIPSEQIEWIFQPFSQIQDGSGRATKGIGIGLSLARKLVELHGGHIEAHSEGLGKGSDFVVRLPISSEHTA